MSRQTSLDEWARGIRSLSAAETIAKTESTEDVG